jgi:hypothetical protein
MAADALTISDEHRLKKQIQQQDIEHSEEWGALKQEMLELKKLISGLRSYHNLSPEDRVGYQRTILRNMQRDSGALLQEKNLLDIYGTNVSSFVTV